MRLDGEQMTKLIIWWRDTLESMGFQLIQTKNRV